MATTASFSTVPWNPNANQDMGVVTWTLANGENGDTVEYAEMADRSVQFSGTFGGGTAILQGSNDGTSWFTLTAPDGTAISTGTAALYQISEATRYIRAAISGGAAGAMVATVFMRRQRRIY